MKDFRGQHRVKVYMDNKEKVRNWLRDNPDKPMKKCAKDLGLSYLTARRHIGVILNEGDALKEL